MRKADECYPIMGDPIAAYLDYDRIINLAKKADCDAIHPGYGFLSESAEFATACADNGIIFIGPKPEHIALFGDKMASKVAMRAVGVPMLPGTDEPIDNIDDAEKIAAGIGFPIIIKAAFGGGGRGMRIVEKASDFKEMYESATNESTDEPLIIFYNCASCKNILRQNICTKKRIACADKNLRLLTWIQHAFNKNFTVMFRRKIYCYILFAC